RPAPGAGAPAPPRAFERTFRPTRPIERIELRHVLLGEGEVEDLRVLRDPFAVRRLRDQRNVALDAPAEQHLGGRPPETLRDPPHRLAREVATGPERAVGLERDPLLTTRVEEAPPVLVGTELHLVDDGSDARPCPALGPVGH